MKKPIRVAITGAAGSIGYAMVFRIAAGEMLGADQPVILQLVELPRAVGALEGVAMELEDCAFPTLAGVEIADSPEKGFKDANAIMLIGGKPRQAGMDRADLIRENGPIFVSQGKAINDHAADDVRVITVANPCNTNCLIAMHNAPRVARSNFSAMTRLDQNRAFGQIASKLGGTAADVANLAVWGNHSPTMFPNFEAATFKGESLTSQLDREWLEGEFMKTVTTRGGAVIKARGASSAASAGSAAIDHMRDWFNPPADGGYLSMAIPSDGSYGVPEGLIFSFPCKIVDGKPEIIQGIELSDYAKSKIAATAKELEGEREVVKDLLG